MRALWRCWPRFVRCLVEHTTSGSDASVIAMRCAKLLDPISGGLLLGSTMAAMFLGHWYLNTPTMELAPLRRLVKLMAGSLALRIAVAGLGLTMIGLRRRYRVDQFAACRPALARRLDRDGGSHLDDLADAQDPQHAKRNRHSLRRRNPHLPWRTVVAATVRCQPFSRMMELYEHHVCLSQMRTTRAGGGRSGRRRICLSRVWRDDRDYVQCVRRWLFGAVPCLVAVAMSTSARIFLSGLGVLIVVLGFAASCVTWAYSRPI